MANLHNYLNFSMNLTSFWSSPLLFFLDHSPTDFLGAMGSKPAQSELLQNLKGADLSLYCFSHLHHWPDFHCNCQVYRTWYLMFLSQITSNWTTRRNKWHDYKKFPSLPRSCMKKSLNFLSQNKASIYSHSYTSNPIIQTIKISSFPYS